MKHLRLALQIFFFAVFIALFLIDKLQLWLILFGISLVLTPVFGRFYCGWLCPINTLMTQTGKMGVALHSQKIATPDTFLFKILPYLILLASITVAATGKIFFNLTVPVLIIIALIGILVPFFFKPYFFHNYMCPYSIFLKFFSRRPLFSTHIHKDNCIGCSICKRKCPANAITVDAIAKKAEIDKSLCHQCGVCVAECPTSTISYSKGGNMQK